MGERALLRVWFLVAVALAVGRPSPSVAEGETWLRNDADATLWSDSGDDAVRFATVPQFPGYFLVVPGAPTERGQLDLYYPGDTAGVEPGFAWVDVSVLGPADASPPPVRLRRESSTVVADGIWLENHAEALLWSDRTSDVQPSATIPQFLGFFLAPRSRAPVNGRGYVYYPGDTSGVAAGLVRVDLDALGPAGEPPPPGPIARPTPPPLISPTPPPLPARDGYSSGQRWP